MSPSASRLQREALAPWSEPEFVIALQRTQRALVDCFCTPVVSREADRLARFRFRQVWDSGRAARLCHWLGGSPPIPGSELTLEDWVAYRTAGTRAGE